MKRAGTIACALLAILTLRGRAGGPQEPARLAVRVVPSGYHERTGRAIELDRPGQYFHVVITNLSDRPVRLWREWCRWGYYSLSFVVTGEDGKAVTVSKKVRGWSKNFPDATIVPPGDHMVFEVAFEEAIWQNPPLPDQGHSRNVLLRAGYEVEGDKESEKLGVWTGRVESPEERFTIWR